MSGSTSPAAVNATGIGRVFQAKGGPVTALDGIGDLIGFFDGIWCQGFEILLKIPWTAAFGITQGPHDCQQLLYRRAHSQSCQPMDRSPTAMKCGLSSDSLPL